METSVNNKCKAFTSLEQSRKLADILPIESADMCFNISQRTNMPPLMTPYCKFKEFFNMGKTPDFLIPCWSLAALLEIIPEVLVERRLPDAWDCVSYAECQITSANNFENLIDACAEVILKLHELKML